MNEMSTYFEKSHKLSETCLATTCVVQATTGITVDRNIHSTKTNGPAVKRHLYHLS